MKTYYEFFAGAGMFRMALGPGRACTFANDIDEKKAASYRANFGSDVLKVCDIAAVAPRDLPGRADLWHGSPPCVDLSEAGAGAGLSAPRSGAVWPLLRLLKAKRAEGLAPWEFTIENVEGWLSKKHAPDFIAVIETLVATGYRVGALVVDAVLFLPQSRPRLFIIAVDAAADIPAALVSPSPQLLWHPLSLVRAHEGLSPTARGQWLWWRLPTPPRRQTRLIDLLENHARIEWDGAAKTQHILGLMDKSNRAKIEDAQRQADGRAVGTLYRRIRPDGKGGKTQRAEVRFDGVAGCLRMPTGGSSRQTIVVIEGDRVRTRLLTTREAARLMGVDDDYVLPRNYNEAYGLMADGVAVPVVRHIAEHILEPLLEARLLKAAE
jgi:DNA (cytosine-5)-methyltransferase 1